MATLRDSFMLYIPSHAARKPQNDAKFIGKHGHASASTVP